jgi:hypothetical protein
MENDPDLGIEQRNRCDGMQWFSEHDTGQEENQRMEAVRSNQKEAGRSNHKVV